MYFKLYFPVYICLYLLCAVFECKLVLNLIFYTKTNFKILSSIFCTFYVSRNLSHAEITKIFFSILFYIFHGFASHIWDFSSPVIDFGVWLEEGFNIRSIVLASKNPVLYQLPYNSTFILNQLSVYVGGSISGLPNLFH